MRSRSIAAMLCCVLPAAASAESMRCGKWVVDEQATPAELVRKCGEPKSKEVVTEDVLGKNTLGNPIKLGTATRETWRYQPTPGALPRVVKILDGKVIEIKLEEKR